MNTELLKKLIVPVLVFLAILAVNTNSIVNAIAQHNTPRIIIACASTVIVLVLLVVVVRRALKGNDNNPEQNQ